MQAGTVHEREQTILTLWEHGAGLDRFARDDTLLAATGVSSRALGARNAALLAMRSTLFDRAWSLRSACPCCATECAFETDSSELATALQAGPALPDTTTFEVGGRAVTLRAPTADDLQAAASQADEVAAARLLLSRCAESQIAPNEIGDRAIVEIAGRIEQLDPGALVSFELRCPDCAEAWSAPVDVGDALWAELQRAAEGLLLEIDLLARTYGWSEGEILGLSPTRRAAYVQLAGAS